MDWGGGPKTFSNPQERGVRAAEGANHMEGSGWLSTPVQQVGADKSVAPKMRTLRDVCARSAKSMTGKICQLDVPRFSVASPGGRLSHGVRSDGDT